MKRLFVVFATLLICSVCLSARNRVYVDSGGVKSELNKQIDLKVNSLHLNFGIGEDGPKFGAHVQHNFNRFLSWDTFCFNYARNLRFDCNQFYITTGPRVFTPAFGRNRNLKFYLSLDVGYCGYGEKYEFNNPYYFKGKAYDYAETRTRTVSSFAICPEFGFFFSKHFNCFANCSGLVKHGEHNLYFFGIGYEF